MTSMPESGWKAQFANTPIIGSADILQVSDSDSDDIMLRRQDTIEEPTPSPFIRKTQSADSIQSQSRPRNNTISIRDLQSCDIFASDPREEVGESDEETEDVAMKDEDYVAAIAWPQRSKSSELKPTLDDVGGSTLRLDAFGDSFRMFSNLNLAPLDMSQLSNLDESTADLNAILSPRGSEMGSDKEDEEKEETSLSELLEEALDDPSLRKGIEIFHTTFIRTSALLENLLLLARSGYQDKESRTVLIMFVYGVMAVHWKKDFLMNEHFLSIVEEFLAEFMVEASKKSSEGGLLQKIREMKRRPTMSYSSSVEALESSSSNGSQHKGGSILSIALKLNRMRKPCEIDANDQKRVQNFIAKSADGKKQKRARTWSNGTNLKFWKLQVEVETLHVRDTTFAATVLFVNELRPKKENKPATPISDFNSKARSPRSPESKESTEEEKKIVYVDDIESFWRDLYLSYDHRFPTGFMSLYLSSKTVSAQVTLLLFALYKKVKPVDFSYKKDERGQNAPNLLRLVCTFDMISRWVQYLIITTPSARERGQYFLKFMKIMQKFLEQGNFLGAFAIRTGLNAGSIAELELQTNLGKKQQATVQYQLKQADMRTLGKLELKAKAPGVVNVVRFTRNFARLNEHHGSWVKESGINKRKLIAYAQQADQFSRLQSGAYNIRQVPEVQSLLMSEWKTAYRLDEHKLRMMARQLKF